MSVDGYIADEAGNFSWETSDALLPVFIELLRPAGMYLYGRRLYELMAYWDGPPENYPPEQREFARAWQAPEKMVFSRTLAGAATKNTRIERNFVPEAIRKLKRESNHDLTIGGADVAGTAFEAGLVDECHVLMHPVIFAGGKPAFRAGLSAKFELAGARVVGAGVVHLHYRVPAAYSQD